MTSGACKPGGGGRVPALRALLQPGVVEGASYRVAEDGRLECEACPRRCKLRDGQRGFCFVREARDGRVVLTAYGRSSGFCIDPIEKKPLNHFYPGSSVLSFGTAGCNLGCRFCQNWDISKAREVDRLADAASPDDVADAALAHGCQSVAFTYNDPVVFQEYALDAALACRERGVKSVAVTAGYATQQTRELFYAQMDAINVDLKAFSERFYHKLCFAQLQPVLDTLLYLKRETDVWFEVTTLLIPGQNDSEDEIERLCDWLVCNIGPDVPLHFTAFHPDFKLRSTPRTPVTTLRRARAQAREAGMRYVYVGNVHDPPQQSTYCHACGSLLIERDWYQLGRWGLEAGACTHCAESLPGHFGAAQSGFGMRRVPVPIRPRDPRDVRRVGG